MTWREIGQVSLSIILGLAGFVAAVGVIARSAQVRWLAWRNIGQPLTAWVEGVAERVTVRIVEEVVPPVVEEHVDARLFDYGLAPNADRPGRMEGE